MSSRLPENEQGLRMGYTTGSCAAAAAAAAAQMLFENKEVSQVSLDTPKGIRLLLDIEQVTCGEDYVRCGVRKDAGDDPDITNGMMVYAVIKSSAQSGVQIDGGIGVGRVTRPGLDQPVGAAAINHVPREMIRAAVERVLHRTGACGASVTIEIPEGEALAAKTFNPKLGIEGGLSVLGTSGIVEPMSEDALKATIRAQLSVRRAEGYTDVVLVPGNYGLDFLRTAYQADVSAAVKCSNYIGDAIDMAAALGFERLLLAGHIGKLIKLSGGIFNTHSKMADARMELLAAAGVRAGVPTGVLAGLFDCVTTEDALCLLEKHQVLKPVMQVVKQRAEDYVQQRAGALLQSKLVIFSNVYGEL